MSANSGEITPPCGVPHFERFPPLYRGRPCSSLSSTGTFSHILTRCSIAASATLRARQVINSACGIVSKYFERSASTTPVRPSTKVPMDLLHRPDGAAFGTIPVGGGTQVGLEDRLQDELRCRLGHPILDGGNSQRPPPSSPP